MNEELRIQVAKCLRWTEIHLATHEDLIVNPTLNGALNRPVGVPPWYKGKNLVENMDPLPRFELDLNACHEFELALFARKNKRNGQVWRYLYESALSVITGGEPISATAEQRCLALLKIKGEKKDG